VPASAAGVAAKRQCYYCPRDASVSAWLNGTRSTLTSPTPTVGTYAVQGHIPDTCFVKVTGVTRTARLLGLLVGTPRATALAVTWGTNAWATVFLGSNIIPLVFSNPRGWFWIPFDLGFLESQSFSSLNMEIAQRFWALKGNIHTIRARQEKAILM